MQRQFWKLYEALGFTEADRERPIEKAEIRTKYREQAKKWHPDKNASSEESINMMGQISAAYAVLGDPEKRAAYDATGAGEEGLEATQADVIGMKMLTDIIRALLYAPIESSQNRLLDILIQGKKLPQPTIKGWTNESLLEAALEMIESAEEETSSKIKIAEQELTILEETMSRLKWKPLEKTEDTPGHRQAKSFNPLANILGRHKLGLEHLIEKGRTTMDELAACRDMLKHYDFDYTKEIYTSSPIKPSIAGGFVSKEQYAGNTESGKGIKGKNAKAEIIDDFDFFSFKGDDDYTVSPKPWKGRG